MNNIAEITNSLRKLIASLGDAKHRRATGLFKAEGTKCVLDTIDFFTVEHIAATGRWIETHGFTHPKLIKCAPRDLERMSSLSTAPEVIAVYRIPEKRLDCGNIGNRLVIALDGIQDPGNMGTIIRTADWFGIDTILCSGTTVDAYSPKVIQATMGAISRVSVYYCDLCHVIGQLQPSRVYGTLLDGDNIYTHPLSQSGIIVMGNEGKGISDELRGMITDRITIPPFPPGIKTSESLNVAIATAITISEFRRRTH